MEILRVFNKFFKTIAQFFKTIAHYFKTFVLLLVIIAIPCSKGVADAIDACQLQKIDTVQLQKIDELLQQKLPNTNVGIVLQDAKTGKILYERRANENFLPASSTKLLTAAAALFSLGPNFQFETIAKIDPAYLKDGVLSGLGGDLFLQFGGDPSLTSDDIRNLIKSVRQAGIKEINGDIVIDNTKFQGPNYAQGWSWNSLPWAYSAPVTSIIINENLVRLELTPNKTLGEKATLALAPEEKTKINISHDIVSVAESEANERCQIMVDMNSQNEITAYGCWPIKEDSEILKVAVQNPILLARQIINEALKEENITLSGQIALGVPPKELKVIASHRSKPLNEMLKPVLQDSNNIFADSITKTMGIQRFQQGSFQSGVLAILESLSKNLGFDSSGIRLQDGSGLSRYNAISPHHLARVLYGMYQNKNFGKVFRDSLAVSGEAGTLKNRMSSFDLNGQVHAKTGNMIGASALAGYLTTRNSKQDLVFVIMINNSIDQAQDLKAFENSLCELFASL